MTGAARKMGSKIKHLKRDVASTIHDVRTRAVQDLHALVPARKVKAEARRKKIRRAARSSTSGLVKTRRRPASGRLEALGWFITAAVILAWPREHSLFDLPRDGHKIDWRRVWPFGRTTQTDHPSVAPAAAETREPGRGRAAEHPGEIPIRGWKDIVWRAYTDFNQDNITQVAGGIAFFGLLAIFPAMAAFVSLYGLFSDVATAQKQLSLLAGVIPASALTLIGDQMVRIAATKHAGLGVAFVVGLLVSIWSANAGMKSLFVGLNVAFEEKEKRKFIKLNLVSLAFTLGAIAFLMLALSAVVLVPVILSFVGYHGAGLSLLRWPLLFLVAVAGFAVLYRYGPSRQAEQWRWLTWGGAIAALLWLCVSLLFSLYVTNFAHYDKTYGSLGAVIGFMSWMWISTIAVLFGAELNSEIEHQTAVDTTTGAPLPMGARGAKMADTLGAARPKKTAKVASGVAPA